MIRHVLPQMKCPLFLTDGGIETTLVFREGQTLPHFAAFHLLNSADGHRVLKECYQRYLKVAQQWNLGIILETPTWRASPDWGSRLGYSLRELAAANHASVNLLRDLQQENAAVEIVVSGCLGPRGDGYAIGHTMTAEQSADYHRQQVRMLADAKADMICGMTLNYTAEAIGMVTAASDTDLPVVISFTVETDGRLPSGQTLAEAVERVDDATDGAPAYYMINCAHPSHFASQLEPDLPWTKRVRGIRANASSKSHEELDQSETLDEGDPNELAQHYLGLRQRLPHLNVLGGCCGTDERHIDASAQACQNPIF